MQIIESGPGRWFKHLLYPGVAGVMLAICLGLIELLKSNPAAGIELLKSWGPGFLLGLLAIVIVGTFLDKMAAAWDKMAGSWQSSVDAQQQVAVSLQRLADKDDRERDRMVTETAFVGQRLERLADEMRAERIEQKAHNDRIEKLMESLQK